MHRAKPHELNSNTQAEQKEKWEIREIGPVKIDGETRAFNLQDLDGNWWEIYHRPGHLYDDLFEREVAHA